MNIQARSSLDPPLENNQDQIPLMNQGSLSPFLTILGVTQILCSFRLALEGKTGKEIPESSILEFLEKFSANKVALSGAFSNALFPFSTQVPPTNLGPSIQPINNTYDPLK